MTIGNVDIAIIGGGPAGIMAALESTAHGAKVVLIDYRDRLGGNYYKDLRPGYRGGLVGQQGDSHDEELEQLLTKVHQNQIPILSDTTVWGVFDESGLTLAMGGSASSENVARRCFVLATQKPRSAGDIVAKSIIVAPGVYDRSIPFPGWTLPGIMSVGGAQLVLKNQGVLPGRRVMVAGTGPLLLALSASLAEAGADVVGVLDTSAVWDGWQQGLQAFFGQWKRVKEAWNYLKTLRAHQIPYHLRYAVFEATGNDLLEGVTFGRVDSAGYPMAGSERQIDVDTLCISYGFLPSTNLTLHLGCAHIFDHDLQTYVPEHTENMETSVPGVLVAGDVTGVGGKDLAQLQGRVAGLTACLHLKLINRQEAEEKRRWLRSKMGSEIRFREALWRHFRFREGLRNLSTDETVICRCEAVKRDFIEQAIDEGYADLSAIKRRTRAGMGPCQGRYCTGSVTDILAYKMGTDSSTIKPLKVRPPIMPIMMKDLQQQT